MSASYDPSLEEEKDWVRLLVGDRDVARPFFQDEELEAILASEGNRYLAAARAAEVILAKDRGLVEKAVDDLRLRWSDNAKSAYHEYINSLRAKGMAMAAGTSFVFRVAGTQP